MILPQSQRRGSYIVCKLTKPVFWILLSLYTGVSAITLACIAFVLIKNTPADAGLISATDGTVSETNKESGKSNNSSTSAALSKDEDGGKAKTQKEDSVKGKVKSTSGRIPGVPKHFFPQRKCKSRSNQMITIKF